MRGRGLLITLFASLALNLFLISAATSAYLFRRHAVAVQIPARRRAIAALPASDRRPFVAMLRANGERIRPENHRARALRDQAWSGLAEGAETADVVKQQLAEARAINQTSRTTVETAVVDYALTLDPAARRALGQALRPPAPSRKPR